LEGHGLVERDHVMQRYGVCMGKLDDALAGEIEALLP
jgi:hypothetical protein